MWLIRIPLTPSIILSPWTRERCMQLYVCRTAILAEAYLRFRTTNEAALVTGTYLPTTRTLQLGPTRKFQNLPEGRTEQTIRVSHSFWLSPQNYFLCVSPCSSTISIYMKNHHRSFPVDTIFIHQNFPSPNPESYKVHI